MIQHDIIIYRFERKDKNMNDTPDVAAEVVEQWRNLEEQDNPAGPLFAAGEFAEADIANATSEFITRCSACSGSLGHPCC